MRYKLLYDGNHKIPLFSAESRAQAVACAENEKQPLCVSLFPSLSADIGAVFRSALFGDRISLDGLRAIGFYFSKIAGWPMREISIEGEHGERFLLPITKIGAGDFLVKTKFCKQKYENICISTHSVSHSACLIGAPDPLIVMDSEKPEAVDFSVLKEARADRDIGVAPLCLASLRKEKMHLRVMHKSGEELAAEDRICLAVLSYFIETERAAHGREYEACGGRYRLEKSGAAIAVRAVSSIG